MRLSIWSARSEARTNDIDGRCPAAIIGQLTTRTRRYMTVDAGHRLGDHGVPSRGGARSARAVSRCQVMMPVSIPAIGAGPAPEWTAASARANAAAVRSVSLPGLPCRMRAWHEPHGADSGGRPWLQRQPGGGRRIHDRVHRTPSGSRVVRRRKRRRQRAGCLRGLAGRGRCRGGVMMTGGAGGLAAADRASGEGAGLAIWTQVQPPWVM